MSFPPCLLRRVFPDHADGIVTTRVAKRFSDAFVSLTHACRGVLMPILLGCTVWGAEARPSQPAPIPPPAGHSVRSRPTQPPTPTDPFEISTDRARFGKRVSQQIPAIARVGHRFFCIWYGTNTGQPGASGEGTGCYNTLAYSDDACANWTEIAYFVPNATVGEQAIIDPRLAATPGGNLLILIPVTAQKGRTRSVWAVQLTNPLAAGGPFTFGKPGFVDFGFVGSTAMINGSLYLTANQNPPATLPWPDYCGMKLHRVVSYQNDQIQTEFVSKLPYAVADGSENSFFEVSLAQVGPTEVLACFRGKSGQFMTRSNDVGKTWMPPARFTVLPNAPNTKADLARSPSGNLVLTFNQHPGKRCNMSLAVSRDGGQTWPHVMTVDDRPDPGTSYPNIAFGAKADGTYDGMIYVAYDHGRGRKAPEFTQEITIAVMAEADLIAGNATFRRYVVSK